MGEPASKLNRKSSSALKLPRRASLRRVSGAGGSASDGGAAAGSSSAAGQVFEVEVVAVKGWDLESFDSNGFSDPFLKLRIGEVRHKTTIQKKTLTPEWNESFPSGFLEGGELLDIECWDWDKRGGNDFMGRCEILFEGELCKVGEWTRVCTLMPMPGSKKMKKTSNLGELEFKIIVKKPNSLIIGPVFGVNVEEMMENQKNFDASATFPVALERLLAVLNERNAQGQVGLFRISGNSEVVEEVVRTMNEKPVKEWKLEAVEDVHVLAQCVKQWLARMPSPLLGEGAHDTLIPDPDHCESPTLPTIVEVVKSLPPARLASYQAVCRYLWQVQQLSRNNKMDAQNLGIVFGPNVCWDCSEAGGTLTAASVCNYRSALAVLSDFVQQSIEHFSVVFPDDQERHCGGGHDDRAIRLLREARLSSRTELPPVMLLSELDPRELFQSYDIDNSGELDFSEFAVFYRDIVECSGKPSPDNMQIVSVINEIDEDGDQTISVDEFLAWWAENKDN